MLGRRGKETQLEPEAPRVTIWGQVVGLEGRFRKKANIVFDGGKSTQFPVNNIGYYGEPTPPVRVGYYVTASVAKDEIPASELKLTEVKVSGFGQVGAPKKSKPLFTSRILHRRVYK